MEGGTVFPGAFCFDFSACLICQTLDYRKPQPVTLAVIPGLVSPIEPVKDMGEILRLNVA